ncbi:HNH endonuclease [Streptosporangium sp. NPDC051022]|uniref:HNH endonuclease n=1 Tax=Streptosporangium sp. NPDC051022 TaxID=3155752 RepID=UPI00342D834A
MSTRCSNGRASITKPVERELFSRASGYCQKPDCCRELFVPVGEKIISFAEMAHIVAAEIDGPRGDSALSKPERADSSNLILLCPACHTLIDKAADEFPVEMLEKWKIDHERRRQSLFNVARYSSREEARSAFTKLASGNRQIFDNYGPYSKLSEDPESEGIRDWRRQVLEHIIPVNRQIIGLLDANTHLLTKGELEILALFRVHVNDFEARHVHGHIEVGSQRYPDSMDDILR